MSNEPKEYKMGGVWGDCINWFPTDQFNGGFKDTHTVVGWKKDTPSNNDLLIAEFQKSWITFKFISIEPQNDPPDMFFADVIPIKQEMKDDGGAK